MKSENNVDFADDVLIRVLGALIIKVLKKRLQRLNNILNQFWLNFRV
jgi:hypothetical protein